MFTLITVNFNCAGRTLALLRSLELQTNKQFSVTVVDNDSEPNDRAQLGEYAASSPLVLDIIYSDHNRGFAGGNNVAVRKALASDSDWTLLINPDTQVGPDFIELVQRVQAKPGIWGIPLDEGERVAYAGRIVWLRPTLPHVYNYSQLPTTYTLSTYPIGGGMLVHREAWDKIGLLDERYFLYFEDADFGMRAHRAGVAIRYLQEPMITHAVSGSTRSLGSPLLLRYHMRNALLFNREHGSTETRILLHIWAFFTMLKQIAKLAFMPARRAHSSAILAGITDFYAQKFGKIKDA